MARYVHVLVKQTAIAMAQEVYESYAKVSNGFYGKNKSMDVWVNKNWGRFTKQARMVLSSMLGKEETSQDQKDIIYEALLADRSIPKGNVSSIN